MIPLIFIFFIFVITPFLYLGQKAENFTNRSSLDIFYTNTKKTGNDCNECSGICESESNEIQDLKLNQLELIDNPIQGQFDNINYNQVLLTASSSINKIPTTFTSSIKSGNSDPTVYRTEKSLNDTGIIIQFFQVDDLIKYSLDKTKNQFFRRNVELFCKPNNIIQKIKSKFDKIPVNSFILITVFGNGAKYLLQSEDNSQLMNYAVNISNVTEGSSSIYLIYKKSQNKYILRIKEYSPSDTEYGPFIMNYNLLPQGKTTKFKTTGKCFKNVTPETTIPVQYSIPFVKSKYNIIMPINSTSSLSFSSENNHSFVFLSPRVDSVVQYSQSPVLDYGPTSTTLLNTEQPQRWTIDPVFNSQLSDTYYIRTHTKPYYYLQIDMKNNHPEISTSLVKGSSEQYWNIMNVENSFLIKHSGSNMYLGYTNEGGYLYNDNGKVFPTKSDKYKWQLQSSTEQKENLPNISDTYSNTLKETQSPNDFPNIKDPRFKLMSEKLNICSNGRTYWNPQYTNIWNGKWIYHGTIATYGKTEELSDTDFLTINLNENGTGTLEDPFFNININIKNVGADALIGTINTGRFNGYMAFLKFIPEKLEYENPLSSYNVKIKYLVTNGIKTFNLSGADIRNLNNYSVKFDGTLLEFSNFLEASGVPVDINLVMNN